MRHFQPSHPLAMYQVLQLSPQSPRSRQGSARGWQRGAAIQRPWAPDRSHRFVGLQILLSPFTPLHFFPGQFSILRQSFALIFITLGSSLSSKQAHFQSHLLTYTEIQAGHKNTLGKVSKQWQSFLMAAK